MRRPFRQLPRDHASAQLPEPCIGMFDSGVGGLSILNAVRGRLPRAPIVYLGDIAHAPYGERAAAEVAMRCETIVAHLVQRGARLIVIACNSATVLAIDDLRDRWPELRFVGVEPGVKPAAARSITRRVAVMATPATAASSRLRDLIRNHASHVHVHVQPCPGLASAIEAGVLDIETLHDVLNPLCEPVRAADVDHLVLGCTHYAFVAPQIQALLGDSVTLVETAAAVADQVATLWQEVQGRVETANVRVLSTGATNTMQVLLQQCGDLASVGVERIAL